MGEIFLIADTHFGHKRVIEFEKDFRPFTSIEEHDQHLVEEWNNVVGNKDIVWHLGDVLFGRHSFETLGRLKGIKKLVLGNHDTYPTRLYLEHFNKVFGTVGIKDKIVLTHVPIHPSQKYRFSRNIHGHLHHHRVDDDWYTCVSVEHTGLKPVPLDAIREGFYYEVQ